MVSRYPGEGRGGPDGDLVRLLHEELRTRVTQQEFETWIAGSPCFFVPPDRFVVTAQSRFRKVWMEKNLRESFRMAARAICEFEPRIDFELEENPPPAPPEHPTA